MSRIPSSKTDLVEAYKTKILFDKYVGENATEENYAKKVTEFIHRGAEGEFEDTYKDPEFDGDNSNFSAYEVFKNVRKGSKKTGNCVGLSQVASYLLQSKGINTELIDLSRHVLISANINNKFIPIETTKKNGFDCHTKDSYKRMQIENLEVIVLHSHGYTLNEKEEWDLAIKDYTKAIELDKKFKDAYLDRGEAREELGESDLAIDDYTIAIALDEKDANAYLKRADAWHAKGKFNLAIQDYEKYDILKQKN
jgi:tetratricopeptide (TPR) repeat protein